MSPRSAPASAVHLTRLDTLRGLAILLVFLFHFNSTVFGPDRLHFIEGWGQLPTEWLEPATTPAWAAVVWYPLTLGWCGVALFFVLSGFVIHWSFLNARNFGLGAFFWRRFWRIYPPYLVALVFFTWSSGIDIQTAKGLLQLVSHVLLIHNLHPASLFAISGVFWSLAVECQFYLIYPVVLLLRRRLGGDLTGMQAALRVTLAASLLWLGLSFFCGSTGIFDPHFTFTLWFDWTLGAYVAECFFHKTRAFQRRKLGALLTALLFVGTSVYSPLASLAFGIVSLFFAIMLDWYVRRTGRLQFWERLLVPLGLCSYSLYLWHHPFLRPILAWLPALGIPATLRMKWLVGLPLSFAILFGASWVLYLTVERFGVSLGSALSPRKLQAAAKQHPPMTLT